jgi:superfamily II DNA or RNA helicase
VPTLRFAQGTLELEGIAPSFELPLGWRWDERTACHRAPARLYADLVRTLVGAGIPLDDRARAYTELASGLIVHREPRPFQAEALVAWRGARGRGLVVLPTGAGKSHVALLAIDDRRRSALVVAPTLELVRQWYDLLRVSFGTEVGVVGGGEHTVLPLTVTTYDSAYLHMEQLGARFGLIVFDECHHLPGATYRLSAELCLAPFRLGLTATPERADGRDAELAELVGPLVYRKDILELSGRYLSDYDVERIGVDLAPDEREEHDLERALYLGFVREQGIRMSSPSGWNDFVVRSSRSVAGRRAMRAYRRQREIAFASRGKLAYAELLLERHRFDRVLIFTEHNRTAYALSHRLLIPAITHQTPVKERSQILDRFSGGDYGAIVTSKVLNEGVDVPAANVAIVISGSGSVREHVQRLGRILRRQAGKHALLYELVSRATGETFTSERRREHEAYRC